MSAAMDPHDDAELLGAYALGAVDDDERARVEDLLTRSPEARAELARYEAALVALTDAEAPAVLPAGGWERTRAAMLGDDDPASSADADADGLAPVLPLPELRLPRRHRRRVRRGPAAFAAAATLVAAGLAVALVIPRDGGSGGLRRAAEAALTADSSRTGVLAGDTVSARAVVDAKGTGYVFGDDLPKLPEGRVYQLWSLDGSAPVSLGVLGDRPGVVAFATGGEVRKLALSVEAAPGVSAPTNPVASGELA